MHERLTSESEAWVCWSKGERGWCVMRLRQRGEMDEWEKIEADQTTTKGVSDLRSLFERKDHG